MDNQAQKSLYAYAIGTFAMNYLETLNPETVLSFMQSDAVNLIAEIKAVLDEENTGDPECFHRIEAIIRAFEAHGFEIARHDW